MLAVGAEDLTVFLNGQSQGDRSQAAAIGRTSRYGTSRLRGRVLATVLSVAGTLAFDLRLLGEVVVDHIGIHDPLDPATLRLAVTEASWSVDEDRKTLTVEARCVHPAIHQALQEV